MSNNLRRILFVDDEPTVGILMRVTLEKSGFEVSLAANGENALHQFRASPHDMVMLDVEMPGGIDGYKVCAALRAEAGDDLPIVMVTGMDDDAAIKRAYAAGATDFIAKPIHWSLIGHRVKYLFRSYMATLELRKANARNAAILDAIPDMMFESDLDGRLLGYHSPRREMLAAPPESFLGHTLDEILPPGATEVCMSALLETNEKGFSTGKQYELQLPQGTRWFELSVSRKAVDPGQAPNFIALARNITERKQAEKHEQFRNRILELLVGGEPLPSVLDAIVRGIEQLHPAMLCSILLLDHEGRHLRIGAAPSLPDFYNTAIDGSRIGIGAGSCAMAAYTGERVIVADIANQAGCESYKELAASAGLGACWSQPIHSASGQVLGTFSIYHHEAQAPAESDIGLIELSARLASIAIERSVAADKLRDSEARFRSLMENIPSVAVQGYVLDGTVIFWNRASEQLYGYSKEEALGANLLELIIPAEMTQGVARAMLQMIDSGQPIPSGELLLKHKDGSRVPVLSSHALVHPIGQLPELFCLDIDLTERRQAEEKLHLAASVFAHAREGIMITAADGAIIDVNDAFTRITGYSRSEVLGRNPSLLSSGHHDQDFYAALWHDLVKKGYWCGEVWNTHKNGEVYAAMQTISAVHNTQVGSRQYVSLFSDITQLKAHERQLEHLAHYDALTNLPNRVLLADRLHQCMAHSLRRGYPLAVVYLDLDGFKAINDHYGHDIGDQLLIVVASRMKETLREGDTLTRLGGDEFVAVLVDMLDVAASLQMLNRLLGAVAQLVQVGDLALQVTASIGVTFYPQGEDVDADLLLRQADQAMYQAKLAGKNRYHVFDAEQDRHVRSHHDSLERIRRALIAREFALHYQPKVNMRSGKLIGAEALIRWQHPEKGLLLPAAFLPEIEEHPLAVEIGEWVIDSALTQMEHWRAAGLEIPVSVNVSASQLLQANFVERLRGLLEVHPGIRTGDLELEVLETSALEDLAGVSRLIEACRELGVLFALDDFGTGYSSLTYLKRLPVTFLKIDQSFVRDMLDDPDDLAILEGVIGLATAFRRKVIAEGVETVEHGEMLLQLGCELAQGYGIAYPMPAADLPGWAAGWRPDPAWAERPAVSRDDLPLLFASVEHHAWNGAVESHLRGLRKDPPPLDRHQSRFGTWLKTEGLARYEVQPAFQAIGRLHQQAYALAAELLGLHAMNRGTEALERLSELHGLQVSLSDQLKRVLRKGESGDGPCLKGAPAI